MGMLVGIGLFDGVGAAFEKGVVVRLWPIVCK
jgi:hypothetical protein